MSIEAKITKVGNSSALILPKEVMAKYNLQQGDTITLNDTPNGLCISPYDEEASLQLELARKVMRDNRNMLRKLAQ